MTKYYTYGVSDLNGRSPSSKCHENLYKYQRHNSSQFYATLAHGSAAVTVYEFVLYFKNSIGKALSGGQ